MHRQFGKFHFLLHLSMACAVFLSLYATLSTAGDVWVDHALRVGARASFFLCAATLGLAIHEKSKPLVIASVMLLVIWVLGPTAGAIECALGGLSGGYSRHTNCGLEASVYIGFFAFFLVVVLLGRAAARLLLLSCLVVPIGFAGAYFHLLSPLKRELSLTDFNATCVVLQSNYFAAPFDKTSATRLRQNSGLDLGWVIGEQTPRLYKLAGDQTDIWRFSQRRFSPSGSPDGLAEFCGIKGD